MRSREWSKLYYLNPENILVGLRHISQTYNLNEMNLREATLRTKELKDFGESRRCALFCYGMSQSLGIKIQYAQSEKSDYDFIAFCEADYGNYFIPIQMKELVPFNLNRKTSLQDEINKLKKYTDSKDLIVAFHINRVVDMVLSEIVIPPLAIGGIWLFGASDLEQENWIVIGNIMKPDAKWYNFLYPR